MLTKHKAMAAGLKLPAYQKLVWTMGFVLILAWWATLSGCSQNQALLTKSSEVTAAFQEGRPNSDYIYYYTGRERAPHAIIGIHKKYQVSSSKLWHVFTPTAEKLTKMAAHVVHYYDEPSYGAYITDSSGEHIGVWYSKLFYVNVQIDHENKMLSVLYKNPELNRGLRSMSAVRRDWKA